VTVTASGSDQKGHSNAGATRMEPGEEERAKTSSGGWGLIFRGFEMSSLQTWMPPA